MGLFNLKDANYSEHSSTRELLLSSGKQHAAYTPSIASSSNPAESNTDATIKPTTGISIAVELRARTSENKRSDDKGSEEQGEPDRNVPVEEKPAQWKRIGRGLG